MKQIKQMNQKATLKNTIGLTQEETAMLLGVTRAQCSMFVSGKRDLPLEAKNKLITLLQHFQNEKGFSEERLQLNKAEIKKKEEQLQQYYHTVQIKLHQVAKKISIIEKTRTECFAALQAVSFLENQKEKHSNGSLAASIKTRATNTLKQHDLFSLTELQLKKESLELLKNRLEQKIDSKQS